MASHVDNTRRYQNRGLLEDCVISPLLAEMKVPCIRPIRCSHYRQN